MTTEIKSQWSGEVLYKSEKATQREALIEAVGKRVNLGGANLAGANLDGANLAEANLAEANLAGAYLAGAYLRGAYLRGAYLRGAYLRGACLRGAYLAGARLDGAYLAGARLDGAYLAEARLGGAYLGGACLGGANLGGANLGGACLKNVQFGAPTMILLASWGDLSDDLTADLMILDAACHPEPESFDRWGKGGPCPYSRVHVQRAAHFRERKELWGKGQACRPYELMMRVIAEKCPEWTDEEIAIFEAKFKQAQDDAKAEKDR